MKEESKAGYALNVHQNGQATNHATKTPFNDHNTPKPVLRMVDAIVIIVGVVVGAGLFRTPSLVAANTGSSEMFVLVWLLGGFVSLVGALCYAELSTSFPNTGGDYHFLMRAFGKRFAFLFAWARVSVIQTGSVALLAYIVGDYISQLYPLGEFASALYAGLVVIALTAINIVGVQFGAGTQKLLLSIQFAGLLMVVIAGFLFTPSASELSALPSAEGNTTALGLAMVFVLLTFGGWNEAGYISAELKSGSRKMVHVLIISILIITAIYLLINLAFLNVLGIERMAVSDAVGVDLMRATMGEPGVVLIGVLVAMMALTSVNATIFTGARTNYALGRDFKIFGFLGKWNTKTSTPVNALIVQCLVALALIGLGAVTRNGFQSMVDFTAPVFWFFFLAIGIALFVLRKKEPNTPRPFKVPWYPLTPIIFCASCAYLLYASLAYTGVGALVGVAILALGTLFFFFIR
ncbi:APC family permease [Parapedobacter deserti]|uniref:APC family permease n=1 Tax=Parapedobacter deserti TaxID=1912957 RepID=A0ABV7JKR8_9SPHI